LLSIARCLNPERYRATRALSASGLFDRSFYLRRHRDVAQAKVDPLAHIWPRGRRSASPLFDGQYRAQTPPLSLTGLKAMHHFLTEGGQQGRSPSQYFDAWRLLSPSILMLPPAASIR
jgi:hypothetical protein